jgi:ribosomal protein S12 methylthiotransferase accessory factor YcaO
MRYKANKRLAKACQAENINDYAETWLDSMVDFDPRSFQVAFLEDMYPACRVAMIEAQFAMDGFGAPFRVHVHMDYAGQVFSLVGDGDTYEAALFSAVTDGIEITDALKQEVQLKFP